MSEDALWLFGAGAATEPAVELQRGIEQLTEWGRTRQSVSVYTIVWDTPNGHVIYLQPLEPLDYGPDRLAQLAPALLLPRWWSTAAVIIPETVNLGTLLYMEPDGVEPLANVYRITPQAAPSTGGVMRSVRRWAETLGDGHRSDGVEVDQPPAIPFQGQMSLDAVAKVLGHRIPIWVEGTLTEANVKRSLAYNQTFPVPDAVTGWPDARSNLMFAMADVDPLRRQNHKETFIERFPLGFTALYLEGRNRFAELHAAHDRLADSGPGWYLACRPLRPEGLPVEEGSLAGKLAETEMLGTKQGANELGWLTREEGNAQAGSSMARCCAAAAVALLTHVSRAAVRYEPDVLLEAPWQGPVAEAWAPVLRKADFAEARKLSRIQRMLSGRTDDEVVGLYSFDTASSFSSSRSLLVVRQPNSADESALLMIAEWPTERITNSGWNILEAWNDKTIIAGDGTDQQTLLVALTPNDRGDMRVQPVPIVPGSNAFAYGYSGGTPTTTYQSLLRCVLGDEDAVRAMSHDRMQSGDSQLWNAISTTKGPLRLPWPQIQKWAREDLQHARETVAALARRAGDLA
ncbi:hypothetical protein ACIA49_38825 [Kribbella sp. NPDC051587]|uniref:hypothetical protein n=1 Tax=Kribbella sp. NPDC051587 TaxID=3364119 RepID=UPI0037B60681